MAESLAALSWLWIPVTVFAALAQTVRNAAQRNLTQQVGTLSATLVRFMYGLPFAAVWLALLYMWQKTPGVPLALPAFNAAYFGWIAVGAFFQVGATAALLQAMRERNFAVAVTMAKTEVLQVALFASVLLHELPTVLKLVAMVLATLGVLLLSLPKRDQLGSWRAWCSKSALYGLAAGACFAIATVGFRAAALAQEFDSPWLSGAWGVMVAQSMQTLALGAWIAFKTPQGLMPVFRAWRVSLLAGGMGAAASLAWFTAYALHDVADIRTLGMVEVVFSYVVSRRMMRESVSRNEKLGMGLMVLGLVLITLGGV